MFSILDGIDLKCGSVDATLAMIEKIAAKEGGAPWLPGGALARHIGKGSEKFAIHVKGLELAAHNIQANQPRGLSYVTASRGACHMSGDNIAMQNRRAMLDSTGTGSTPCSPVTTQNEAGTLKPPGRGKQS